MGAAKSLPVDEQLTVDEQLQDLQARLKQKESGAYQNLSEEEKLCLVKGRYDFEQAWAATDASALERMGVQPANAAALALALCTRAQDIPKDVMDERLRSVGLVYVFKPAAAPASPDVLGSQGLIATTLSALQLADLPTRGKRLTHVHVSLPGVGMLRHFTLVQLHEARDMCAIQANDLPSGVSLDPIPAGVGYSVVGRQVWALGYPPDAMGPAEGLQDEGQGPEPTAVANPGTVATVLRGVSYASYSSHPKIRDKWVAAAQSGKASDWPYAALLEKTKHMKKVAMFGLTPIESGLIRAIYERETKRQRRSSPDS